MYFLDEDLSFQKIDDELASLSTMYGGENGCLLLAEQEQQFIGMVALRKKTKTICEMKRLFVLPSVTGLGVGKKLTIDIIEQAKKMGFKQMVLDTLQRLEPAMHLYQQLGFKEIPAYYKNPLPEVVFMCLELKNANLSNTK